MFYTKSTELVGQKNIILVRKFGKTQFNRHCFGFQSQRFSLLVGYNIWFLLEWLLQNMVRPFVTHKQVQAHKRHPIYVPVISKTTNPPPPVQTPVHLTFVKNSRYVASLDGHGINAPPVRASKRVKSFIQMYIFCNKQLATVWINN